MTRPLVVLLQCLVAVAVVGNLCALAYWVRTNLLAAEKKAEADKVEPKVKTEQENKTIVIRMNPRAAESFGVAAEPARAGVWRERSVVFGRVVPNPKATYEIRCPFPGTLQAAGPSWPTSGQTVRPGQLLARVAVRIAPDARLELQGRFSEARLKMVGAREVVGLRENLVNRLQKAGDASVTLRELEDAQVALVEARTLLKTSTEWVDLWEKALKEIDAASGDGNGPWTRALTAPDVGLGAVLEVAEIAGQPGMAVEAGALVLRLVDVSRPLVRLDLPAEALRDGPAPAEVNLRLAAPQPPALRGAMNRPEAAPPDPEVRAVLVGPVAQADLSSQFLGYYYTVPRDADALKRQRLWRPGLFVQATLLAPTPETVEPNAVVVPAAAVLYHQGRALVYLQSAADKYERREVQVLGFRDDLCYLAERSPLAPPTVGLAAGDKVVSSGAQALLSTEFRRDSDDD